MREDTETSFSDISTSYFASDRIYNIQIEQLSIFSSITGRGDSEENNYCWKNLYVLHEMLPVSSIFIFLMLSSIARTITPHTHNFLNHQLRHIKLLHLLQTFSH